MQINKVELRNLEIEDYIELKNSMLQAYEEGVEDPYWKKEEIRRLLKVFPEGQIVIVVDDIVVGAALSLIVDENLALSNHKYNDIVTDSKFKAHNPEGDVLYGIDIFIHPNYRGLRLGRRLYDARKELCEQLNLKSIIFAGRIPNYHTYAKEFTPKQYLEKVKNKEIHDPVISFQVNNDFHIKRLLRNYLEGDYDSKDYAVLLEWNNISYEKTPVLINAKKSVVRLGLIQWQMRPLNNLEEFFDQAEFFIDAVSGYESDFATFPGYLLPHSWPIIIIYLNLKLYVSLLNIQNLLKNVFKNLPYNTTSISLQVACLF